MAKKVEQFNDLGLGTKASSGKYRAFNKDGSINAKKVNVPFFEKIHFFHSLINMSWTMFFVLLIIGYSVVNLLFASLYAMIGVENLTSIEGLSSFDKFMEAFYFSSQTITTLGYGRVAPLGHLANIIATIESMIGLLGFAMATGLLYGRFSKPSAKIKYSSHAVIAPYKDINGFMFRIVNPHYNQLLELEVSVSISLQRENSEMRDFHFLELERSKVNLLPSMWTIVHPIDDKSPIKNFDSNQLIHKDAEFIIMLKAFDESFSQFVYSRTSYKANEIKWGEKFVYAIKQSDGGIEVDVGRLDETQKMDLN